MPPVPVPVSDATLALGQLAIVVTVVSWAIFVGTTIARVASASSGAAFDLVAAVLYVVVVTLVAASSLAYLTSRMGFFHRARSHRRVPRAELEWFLSNRAPSLTVLVPSYAEDARVIRMTLLSAALQEYPSLRIVLLIDDPPEPRYAAPARLLEDARALPAEIERLLAAPRSRFAAALAMFEARGGEASAEQIEALAVEYEYACRWLRELARGYTIVDNTDRFLVDNVISRLAADLKLTATALRSALDEGATLPAERVHHLHQRLVWTFSARLAGFERKQYVSLSHAPNKAMNLNSYIGLMGSRLRDVITPSGRVLVPAADEDSGEGLVEIPDSDYVLTLDADSVLLPEYCSRLAYLLEQSEHAHVAVAQTPYSAFPDAETRIERVAGATTDLQHIVHQGMSYYDATFWVGANAVLRKRALEDVRRTEYLGSWPVHTFISDRTVIEDTESTIDLGIHGWRLLNYPERLSYSATPSDFGSLCIQRRRWANGGLLILGALRRQARARRRRGEYHRLGELCLRVNYLASICWSTLALLFLMAYQFDARLLTLWLLPISVPYFMAIASDLRYCGYRRLDTLRIYGLNLILLAVNLAGVASSLLQGLTSAKPAFRRTPKVRNRTVAGLFYVLVPYVLVGLSAYTLVGDYHHHRVVNAIFASINLVLGTYAIVFLIGVGHSIADVWVNVVSWLYKPEKTPKPTRAAPMPVVPGIRIDDWEHVLHFGGASSQHPASATVPWQPPAMGRLSDRPAAPSVSVEEEAVGDATVATAQAEPADGDGLDLRLKKASKRFRRPPPTD